MTGVEGSWAMSSNKKSKLARTFWGSLEENHTSPPRPHWNAPKRSKRTWVLMAIGLLAIGAILFARNIEEPPAPAAPPPQAAENGFPDVFEPAHPTDRVWYEDSFPEPGQAPD